MSGAKRLSTQHVKAALGQRKCPRHTREPLSIEALMLRRTLVIHALNTGGAERVASRLANRWAEDGVHVTLVTLDSPRTDDYPLDARVDRVGLGLLRHSRSMWGRLFNNLRRVVRLRRAIRAADAVDVISFTDRMNVLTLMACAGGSWHVTIAERNDPRRQWMGRGWEWLRRRTYGRCSAAVVQTQGVADYVRRLTHGRPAYVIPNAVPAITVSSTADREPTVIAMGRLDSQKGFDLLLQAFARVAVAHPQWKLQILGEGRERAHLVQLSEELGLHDRIQFCGRVQDPQPLLAAASLFVLSSRYEGFPNALLEAMANGLGCVSFACDSGPAEIIRHGIDGWLVPPEDVSELAHSMDLLMRDDRLRGQLGSEARDVTTRFNEADFFARWERVFASG